MTLDATISLLRAILHDVPAAITTGEQLMRLIERAVARLSALEGREVSREEIEHLVDEIRRNSERISELG